MPTVLGFIYFVLPGLIKSGETSVSHMDAEGYIYRDLYINFVPFIPFALYYIIYMIKNKKNSFSVILTIILIAFILVTFIGGMKGKVSSYYYFKSYFCLWIFIIYLTHRALSKFIENKETKPFAYTYLLIYITMVLIVFFGIDQKITDKNILFNPSGKAAPLLDAETINLVFMNREDEILNKEQIEAIKYLNNIIDENDKDNVIVYGDMLERIWVYVLTDITDSNTLSSLYECPINTLQDFTNSDKKYLLYIANKDKNIDINENSSEYTIIYSNENALILQKNI